MGDTNLHFTSGEGIQALREMHGMSLDQLSLATGIDHKRLVEIEKSTSLSEADAHVLARALGTYPRLLLSWNG